jgi:hypothetical protein
MFSGFDIKEELLKLRSNVPITPEDEVIQEVNKILAQSIYKEQNILHNLKSYQKTFEVLDEEGLKEKYLYTTEELKQLCINLRLKFLDSQNYPFDVPYEAISKINQLNKQQGKNIHGFKIMSTAQAFKKPSNSVNFALFAPTLLGNYYLIHSWGHRFKWYQKILAFPLRSFETLAVCLIMWTAIVTLCLPTFLITLDRTATYWSGYRAGTFFHLLIFFSGISAYILVGFNKRFSGSVWQEEREFD